MILYIWGPTMGLLTSMSPSTPHQMISDEQFESQLWWKFHTLGYNKLIRAGLISGPGCWK